MNEVETMDTAPSSNEENNEIENFNDDTISTTTTITTNDELDNQSASTSSSSSKIIESNDFLHQYDEIEILKQMLYEERQKNRDLINDIRNLRGLDSQTVVSKEKEEEEVEDERMKLEYLNDH